MLLWMSIGLLLERRGEKLRSENNLCLVVTSAFLLVLLHHLGGELWGSRNIALPFALTALIVAAAGSLNIKGQDVQGEINPHEIMRMKKHERDEE
ncbi:MAG: hypothetical protein Ct9H90mP23_1050 [Methanobacteriota archaeon]|nr:MAG: hypothetical protein Ct9H90mP23_1050 [Euryarchaeota archaeon]